MIDTDAIIAYGHDLGGGDGEFELLTGKGWTPGWYNPDDENEGFAEQAMTVLLRANGFRHHRNSLVYTQRRGMAEAALGVEVVEHCSNQYTMYLLVAKVVRASRGHPQAVDVAADLVVPDGADERLTWALGVLGIKPKSEHAAWLLASWWDGA